MPLEPTTGALQGLRVIDLSRVLGGPMCTQILADHGASVLKIEPPQGDETRAWGPPFQDGVASYFLGLNRNKVGCSMDLKQPAVRDQLRALLADADVLVENFKTGSMEQWGLGFEALHAQFPRLVHCRVSGFGADGPLGGLPGYDAAIQALSGIMSVNGEPGGEPLRVGLPVVDVVTGLNAALGIMMALQERQRSGLGQFVEATLFDCGLSLLHPHAANWLLDGRAPRRSGNAHTNIYPYDTFATGTEPLFLAVGNDTQFATLCRVIGLPGLASDPLFASNGQRSVNRVALKLQLEKAFSAHAGPTLADTLVRAGVPCAPIQDVATALTSAHTQHRNMVVRIGDGYAGVASPIKLSRTPASYRLAPPKLLAPPSPTPRLAPQPTPSTKAPLSVSPTPAGAAARAMLQTPPFSITALNADQAQAALPSLCELLIDCVEGGASVGFMSPLQLPAAQRFWQGVIDGVARQARILIVAQDAGGRVWGTVQLITEQPENQAHRADVAKMLVHRSARRQGLAQRLLAAVEATALAAKKRVLVLDTVTGGDAERLYARCGWARVGSIPDYALMPTGEPCATTVFSKAL